MKKIFSLLFAIVLFTPSTSHALLDLIDIDASVGVSIPTPSGSITMGTGASATPLDLVSALNLGNGSDTIAKLDFKHFIPIIPNIYLHHLPVSVAGDKAYGAGGVNIAGTTYAPSQTLHSEITINQDDLGLYWGVPFLGIATAGMLHANFGLNLRNTDFKASFKVNGSNVVNPAAFTTVIPMLYVEADFTPPFLSIMTLEVEAKTLPYAGSSISEYSAELKIKPIPVVYIGLGY
jgi:outer membrane protein